MQLLIAEEGSSARVGSGPLDLRAAINYLPHLAHHSVIIAPLHHVKTQTMLIHLDKSSHQ